VIPRILFSVRSLRGRVGGCDGQKEIDADGEGPEDAKDGEGERNGSRLRRGA
jgi:hypothetical protein